MGPAGPEADVEEAASDVVVVTGFTGEMVAVEGTTGLRGCEEDSH
jgi:hypothetical protein